MQGGERVKKGRGYKITVADLCSEGRKDVLRKRAGTVDSYRIRERKKTKKYIKFGKHQGKKTMDTNCALRHPPNSFHSLLYPSTFLVLFTPAMGVVFILLL
jgi:hypothetical protein